MSWLFFIARPARGGEPAHAHPCVPGLSAALRPAQGTP